jgi:hypothetical protein
MTYVGPICSSPNEKLAQYIRRTYSWWQSHSSPLSVLSNLVYTIVVSIPTEERNIHIHTSPLIPQVAPTRLTLCGQRFIHHNNIFMPCGSGHCTFPSLYSPWVHGHDSSHDGLEPLPHDRDCPQANLALRQRVWDSHHPVGGYLPSSLGVGKSLLACHLSRLL